MVDRPTISFAQAQAAMAAMIEKATRTPELPVSMAIVDAAGNLLAFATMDNLRLFTPRHAIRKAYTAAITGLNSTVHAEWLKTRGLTVGDFGGDPMLTPSGGGIVVRPATSAQRSPSPWARPTPTFTRTSWAASEWVATPRPNGMKSLPWLASRP